MQTDILTVLFEPAGALLAQEPHLAHGGLFVPCPDPAPAAFAALQVVLCVPGGAAVRIPGRVVQVVPGAGVALAFDHPDDARRALGPLLERARAAGGEVGQARTIWGEAPAPPPAARRAGAPEPAGTLHDRIRAMGTSERRQLALRGDRTARMILMRDVDKSIHTFVIKNPGITIDEVRTMAAYRQTNPEVLGRIAETPDWIQHSRIASALVMNPKTPSSLAVRLLDRLSQAEVGRIARMDSAPPAVVAAARRKTLGK